MESAKKQQNFLLKKELRSLLQTSTKQKGKESMKKLKKISPVILSFAKLMFLPNQIGKDVLLKLKKVSGKFILLLTMPASVIPKPLQKQLWRVGIKPLASIRPVFIWG